METWLFNIKSFLQLETILDYSLTEKLMETEQSNLEYLVLTRAEKKKKKGFYWVDLFSFPFPFFSYRYEFLFVIHF